MQLEAKIPWNNHNHNCHRGREEMRESSKVKTREQRPSKSTRVGPPQKRPPGGN